MCVEKNCKTYFAVYYFVYYCLSFSYRSISRTASCEEMEEDSILKITYMGIFYKHYRNRKTSLEYLIYKKTMIKIKIL